MDELPGFALEGTFDSTIGLQYQKIEPTEMVASFEVREELLGPLDRLHGGVFASAAESVASYGRYRLRGRPGW